jgi:SPP1 gp7 family putative phage head morphogenesis protein
LQTTNELLQEKAISHAIYLERYKTFEIRKIMGLLNRVDQDITFKLLTKNDGTWTKQRMEKLLLSVRDLNKEAFSEIKKRITGDLKEFVSYESAHQIKILNDTIPVKLNIVQPSPNQLWASAMSKPLQSELFTKSLNTLSRSRVRNIEGVIRNGFVEGQTIQQIGRRIRGSRALKYKDGILEVNRRQAEAWARTSVAHVANTARERTFQENGSLIKGVQFIATLDGGTTVICASYGGEIFDVDKGPRPPIHWSCRSTTVPVIKSWKELGINLNEAPPGTRASMNGQVPSSMNYQQWLEKQSHKIQEDVLGKTKARLFREGTPIKKFVDNGKVLTLEELGVVEKISVVKSSKPPVVPAFKSVKEANKWALEHNVADKVNFKGIDPKLAQEWLQGASNTQHRFPELKMDFIGSAQERNKFLKQYYRPEIQERVKHYYEEGTKQFDRFVTKLLNQKVGRMSPNTVAQSWQLEPARGVTLNTKFAKSTEQIEEMVRRNIISGHWASGYPNVSFIISHEMGHEIARLLNLHLNEALTNIWRTSDIAKNLSKYGNSTIHEMIAEGWAEYSTSKAPRPISKMIGEIIEEEYKNWKNQ